MGSPMFPLVFATLFVTGALLCISLSFATDHWIETIVQRTDLKAQAKQDATLKAKLETTLYFSRNRGMFRTCYPGNETNFLDTAEHVVDGTCIAEMGYELDRNPDTVSYGDDYDTRIHLLRAHFAFFVISLLMLVISSILGVIGCWTMRPSLLRAVGLVAFFAAFFALGGMAFFHGYEYIENQMLDNIEMFPAYWQTKPEHFVLQQHSHVQYGYSYMLGWIGVGLASIAAILFICSAMSADTDRDEKMPLSDLSDRNRAYDMMQQPMQPMQPMMAPTAHPTMMAQHPQYLDYGQQQQQQYVPTPTYAASNAGYDYPYGRY